MINHARMGLNKEKIMSFADVRAAFGNVVSEAAATLPVLVDTASAAVAESLADALTNTADALREVRVNLADEPEDPWGNLGYGTDEPPF